MLQPLTVAPEHTNKAVPSQLPPATTQVVIVDDDASVCKALSRLFRAAGIESVSYDSAEKFLADERLPEPDCLILDIQLTGMSGLELQQTLRAKGRDVPIIFITAFDELDSRLQAEAAGCAAYLRKTDPGDSVLETIQRIARKRKTSS
jgi:FixJ family two-component response regulator